MDSTKKTARLAGLLYLVASIPGAFALVYVPLKLSVPGGDAAAKADRIRAWEGLLRAGIAAELVGTVLFIFVALTLYRLFQSVAEGPARAMLVLILLSVPISMLNVVNEVAALDFAVGRDAAVARDAGRFLSALDPGQRDALASYALHLHFEGIMVAQVFWGLWLFPFGICVMRSGFIPRFLGVLLMIAGCGYVAKSLAELALPQSADAVGRVTGLLTVLELPIILWLLIWGAKPQRAPARAA